MSKQLTDIKHKLGDKLKDAKTKTILYLDYYYFVLDIDNKFEFWLNPNHFLGELDKVKIDLSVFNYLENHCPKFIDFYKNGEYHRNSSAEWKENLYYSQNIPEIGNAYSAMIYKISTEMDTLRNKRVIHLHQDWGPSLMADFDTIGEKEVTSFLTLTVFSETHKQIKSIFELDCFKSI